MIMHEEQFRRDLDKKRLLTVYGIKDKKNQQIESTEDPEVEMKFEHFLRDANSTAQLKEKTCHGDLSSLLEKMMGKAVA